MHAKPLQCFLCFPALLGTVLGRIPSADDCTAKAWVRAPDLVPDTIVQGDARVKISAGCPTIDTVSLGLRFKERSFAKTLRSREDVKRLGPISLSLEFLSTSPWPSHFVNQSRLEAFEELLTNKDLWTIREEERMVFEIVQPFDQGVEHHGVLRDAVQDFAILVPSTNFPPGLETWRSGAPGNDEIIIVEWIYEYFAQISFSDGTAKDVFAGFTSFQPLYDSASAIQGPSSATIELQRPRISRGDRSETLPVANYSIELSADSGLSFFAGKQDQIVNAIVTRTGLARTFSAPLNVRVCVMPNVSPKWAAEYDKLDDRVNLGPRKRLEPTLRGALVHDRYIAHKGWRPACSFQSVITATMPDSTLDEIQAEKIVTTTSARFTIPIELDEMQIANFEMYYQTLVNALAVTLQVPLAVDEDVDPDDPSGERNFGWGQEFEEDEEAWVPWQRMAGFGVSYSGSASVAVYSARSTLLQPCHAASTWATLDQAVLSDGDARCERRLLVHYLNEGARGPIFVDPGALHALLAEDPAERAQRAPVLEPVVSSPPEGEELVYRYYSIEEGKKSPIYVGETWAKKVARRGNIVIP